MTLRRTSRLVAAVLVTAAAGLAGVVAAPSSSAAACTTDAGVTVVADFNQLDGGVVTKCLGDGAGKTAWDLFTAAGLPLTAPNQQPGFVCRVSGEPASDPCRTTSPADRYWGLWWSDGDAGSTWSYSTLGAGSLKIPAGGLVALSWDEVAGDEKPSAAAERPAPASSPTATPTTSAPTSSVPTAGSGAGGGNSGSQQGGGSSGSGGSTPAPGSAATPDAGSSATETPTPGTADPSATSESGKPAKAGKRSADEPTASTTPDADESQVTDADPTLVAETDAAQTPDSGLAGWVAPALIVVLFGGAGLAWWLRRRGAAQL